MDSASLKILANSGALRILMAGNQWACEGWGDQEVRAVHHLSNWEAWTAEWVSCCAGAGRGEGEKSQGEVEEHGGAGRRGVCCCQAVMFVFQSLLLEHFSHWRFRPIDFFPC